MKVDLEKLKQEALHEKNNNGAIYSISPKIILELIVEIERLRKAITDNRLTARHFEVWKEIIQGNQKYDSELTDLLERLQQALAECEKGE